MCDDALNQDDDDDAAVVVVLRILQNLKECPHCLQSTKGKIIILKCVKNRRAGSIHQLLILEEVIMSRNTYMTSDHVHCPLTWHLPIVFI